jgi:hypothetical protein
MHCGLVLEIGQFHLRLIPELQSANSKEATDELAAVSSRLQRRNTLNHTSLEIFWYAPDSQHELGPQGGLTATSVWDRGCTTLLT